MARESSPQSINGRNIDQSNDGKYASEADGAFSANAMRDYVFQDFGFQGCNLMDQDKGLSLSLKNDSQCSAAITLMICGNSCPPPYEGDH